MREGQCHYTGTGNSDGAQTQLLESSGRGRSLVAAGRGPRGRGMGGKKGEAGWADDKEPTHSPIFILRTTGSWKPETGRSGLSGCGGKGAGGSRALC